MGPENLIALALQLSITVMVFGLGLRLSPRDTLQLLRQPRLLLRSVLSINVFMPLFAAALVASFDLHPPVKIALVLLSVSPVPPLLPLKVLRSAKDSSYVFSLLITEAVLAIVLVPASVAVFEKVSGARAHSSPLEIGIVVLVSVLGPIGAAMLVRQVNTARAERMAKPLLLVAAALLGCSLIPILVIAMPAIISLIGDGTLAALAAFVLAGLGAGHLLGGPEPGPRFVLAISTASRHPGVALAVATANFPGEKFVLATLLLYLIVNAIVTLPYLLWQSRRLPSSVQQMPLLNKNQARL